MKRNLKHKLHILEIAILNTKSKDCKSHKNLRAKNFTYTKNFYLQDIAAVNLSKIFFQKNAKENM